MRTIGMMSQVAFAPEDGAGGAGAGAGGGGGGGSPPPGGAAAPAMWDFADLPEGLRGATNEDTYGKVKGEYFNLRNKAAAFAPPKDAKDYKFEPADNLKSYFKNADDPFMSLAREQALKTGLPDGMFGNFINGLFSAAADKGLLPQSYDPHAEIAAIGEMIAPGKTGADARTAVQAALTEAEAFAPALADSMKLSAKGKQAMVSLAQEAGGIEILRAIKSSGKELGLQVGGTQQQQGYGWSDYDRDVADPRYQALTPKYDKSFREGVDAKMRALSPRGS